MRSEHDRSLKATIDYLASTLGGAVYAGTIGALVPHDNQFAVFVALAIMRDGGTEEDKLERAARTVSTAHSAMGRCSTGAAANVSTAALREACSKRAFDFHRADMAELLRAARVILCKNDSRRKVFRDYSLWP